MPGQQKEYAHQYALLYSIVTVYIDAKLAMISHEMFGQLQRQQALVIVGDDPLIPVAAVLYSDGKQIQLTGVSAMFIALLKQS